MNISYKSADAGIRFFRNHGSTLFGMTICLDLRKKYVA